MLVYIEVESEVEWIFVVLVEGGIVIMFLELMFWVKKFG